jgi:hypothetical protein
VAMMRRVSWFGLLPLLFLALALPVPAWARVVYSDSGAGTSFTFIGDGSGNISPVPGFGSRNPAICITTDDAGLVRTPITPAQHGVTSSAETPNFFLNAALGPVTVPPSLIVVRFKVRVATDPINSFFLVQLKTLAGPFNLFLYNRGPQPSSIGTIQTKVTGTGVGGSDTIGGYAFSVLGSGTLTVESRIIPDPAARAIFKNTSDAATLFFTVVETTWFNPPGGIAACVDDIAVEVIP